jgi:hypothetical protein
MYKKARGRLSGLDWFNYSLRMKLNIVMFVCDYKRDLANSIYWPLTDRNYK